MIDEEKSIGILQFLTCAFPADAPGKNMSFFLDSSHFHVENHETLRILWLKPTP